MKKVHLKYSLPTDQDLIYATKLFDQLKYLKIIDTKSKGKAKAGIKTVRFAQPNDGSKGIIPRILQQLLKARKDTKKLMKIEKEAFKKLKKKNFELEDTIYNT